MFFIRRRERKPPEKIPAVKNAHAQLTDKAWKILVGERSQLVQPHVQQIDDQCYPDLRLYCILWLTKKLFYIKVLLERLKENLYVPPCPVHLCDVFRADGKIVSQNHDGLSCLFVD